MNGGASREKVLQAIQTAITRGGAAQLPAPVPVSTGTPAEALVAEFVREAEAVGAQVASVDDLTSARQQVCRWLEADSVRRAVCAPTAQAMQIVASGLAMPEIVFTRLGTEMNVEAVREASLSADAGISDADFGLADTGTLVLRATSEQGRWVSLLPPIYIAVLSRGHIVPNLAACLGMLDMVPETRMRSLLTLITGPSRTADIELTLSVGVHGPGKVCILLVD